MSEGPVTSREVTTLYTVDTVHSADSIEWCPTPGYQHLYLCGTYQLVKEESQCNSGDQSSTEAGKCTRVGRVDLYDFKTSNEETTHKLDRVTFKDAEAVPDIKWSHSESSDFPQFATVEASGDLSLWQLVEKGGLDVERLTSVCLGAERLALSLDWSNRVDKSSNKIVASDSKGDISLLSLDSNELVVTHQWKAHDFEAWIAAFNYWNTDVVYSGGDDCFLKGWDLRISTESAVFQKRHPAGVCSIQSHPRHEHTLVTGGYDEKVSIWDSRQMRRPVSETSVEGGVWRVKWDPWTGHHLLTACMYNGFHVLDCTTISESGQDIVCSYMDHGSISYGADWCFTSPSRWSKDTSKCDNTDTVDVVIATCSFYDHLMKLWTWSVASNTFVLPSE